MKQPSITDLASLRRSFDEPPAWARPTPLYWWSGSDLDRDRLAWQLDQLAAGGVGGTIVGYSHLPNGDLDHGDPAPFSEAWWELYTWFVEASAERGLSVGIQDYGVLNPLLVTLGDRLGDRNAGSLEHVTAVVDGGATWTLPLAGTSIVSVAAWPTGSVPLSSTPDGLPTESGGELRWVAPAGSWTVSVVTRRDARIGPWDSSFDPLHPDSGAAVIEAFYEPFAHRLGGHLGTTFTTFFQDELEFGLHMPWWNDDVADACAARGFAPETWVHGLWLDLDDGQFRAFYRDTVVGMLERNYFIPVFDWHERHGTRQVMDQLSRGDLRTGRRHYGDYLETMKWYQGPGNDDPDLDTPRHSGEFRVSASIAHLYDRPVVVNEAFHSSGWGIAPADIVRGANIGFVSGANHLILHAVYYSTEGGWWEWAAPDFHFRQPWWRHSAALSNSLARTGALLRAGRNVADVAVVDPTQDLELTGQEVRSPELAFRLLPELGARAINADLVPMSAIARSEPRENHLAVERAEYRVVVVPAISTLRRDCLEALDRFVARGGTVLAAGALPRATEYGPVGGADMAGWLRCGDDAASVAAAVRAAIEPDLEIDRADIAVAHRRLDDAECYFVVNTGVVGVTASCSVRGAGAVERWDAETGITTRVTAAHSADGRTRFDVTLEPGQGEFFLLVPDGGAGRSAESDSSRAHPRTVAIAGPWEVTPSPTLDNRFGDFEYGGRDLGVETWQIETAGAKEGPWTARVVRDGVRFFVLGPVPAESAAGLSARFSATPQLDADSAVRVGDIDLAWRPYRFSMQTGITDDPLQRDRMTGPHGLKSVSDDFLDPTVIDPDARPGEVYVFWSAVENPLAATSGRTVTVSTRTRLSVWIGGEHVGSRAEVPVHRFAPWSLRDASPRLSTEQVDLGGGATGVLVAMTVSDSQPSRAAVVIGGAVSTPRPKSRLAWWHGPSPALAYRPSLSAPGKSAAWVRAVIPPGATSVEVRSSEPVVGAEAGGRALPVSVSELTDAVVSIVTVDGETGPLLFELGDSRADGVEPVLTEPLRWQTSTGVIDLADWSELGLADYSGALLYRADVDLPGLGSERVELELSGLIGTAAVKIDDVPIGTIFTGTTLDVSRGLRAGVNRIEIEVANTLANYAARLPSPYSGLQPPSGGFTAATLRVVSLSA